MSLINTDETTTHYDYKDFYKVQEQYDLSIGDAISLIINGKILFQYTAQYSNGCMAVLEVQDIGSEKTDIERLEAEIERLQTELEALINP